MTMKKSLFFLCCAREYILLRGGVPSRMRRRNGMSYISFSCLKNHHRPFQLPGLLLLWFRQPNDNIDDNRDDDIDFNFNFFCWIIRSNDIIIEQKTHNALTNGSKSHTFYVCVCELRRDERHCWVDWKFESFWRIWNLKFKFKMIEGWKPIIQSILMNFYHFPDSTIYTY